MMTALTKPGFVSKSCVIASIIWSLNPALMYEPAYAQQGRGQGGCFQRFDFEGELIWDYSLNNETQLPHHDIAVLPNGNFVAIVWQKVTPEQARLGGRRQEWIAQQGLWPDALIEFQPIPPNDARIVWQWNGWDHIIQDVDPNLDNFGSPADHPGVRDRDLRLLNPQRPLLSPAP